MKRTKRDMYSRGSRLQPPRLSHCCEGHFGPKSPTYKS